MVTSSLVAPWARKASTLTTISAINTLDGRADGRVLAV